MKKGKLIIIFLIIIFLIASVLIFKNFKYNQNKNEENDNKAITEKLALEKATLALNNILVNFEYRIEMELGENEYIFNAIDKKNKILAKCTVNFDGSDISVYNYSLTSSGGE